MAAREAGAERVMEGRVASVAEGMEEVGWGWAGMEEASSAAGVQVWRGSWLYRACSHAAAPGTTRHAVEAARALPRVSPQCSVHTCLVFCRGRKGCRHPCRHC